MTLPNCLTEQSAADAMQSRADMGKPFTDVAWTRFLSRCERYDRQGYDVDEMIDRMVTGGQKGPWLTVYRRDDCRKPKKQRETTVTNLSEVRVNKLMGISALAEMKLKARAIK